MRNFRSAAILLALAANACSSEQPQVTVHVELAEGERIVDCPTLSGFLGQSFEVTLANGMKVSGAIGALGDDGRSKISINFPAGYAGAPSRPREMTFTANLANQQPSFQYSVPQSEWRFTVLVESQPLLATTRAHPSWKEFQTSMKSNYAFERTNSQQGCAPLLRAAQLGR